MYRNEAWPIPLKHNSKTLGEKYVFILLPLVFGRWHVILPRHDWNIINAKDYFSIYEQFYKKTDKKNIVKTELLLSNKCIRTA